MGISSSLLGKDLPSTLWQDDLLHLPPPLAKAHKDFLESKGWISEYMPASAGGKGGDAPEEAREHVINRFLNSAARMQFVCSDPLDEQPEVREMVLDQLGEGSVFLLDIAAGNGAGTLAILSLLTELREKNYLPKLPVNVSISAVDYSPDALNYYAEILEKITPWLNSKGIDITLDLHVCDLTICGEFSEALESYFDNAKSKNGKRFLCVISALSGAKMEGIESMHDSLKIAAAGLSHSKRCSSWLWVEPHVGKSWIIKAIDSIRLTMKKIKNKLIPKSGTFQISTADDVPLLQDPNPRQFKWNDPHLLKPANSHVFVMAFKNE